MHRILHIFSQRKRAILKWLPFLVVALSCNIIAHPLLPDKAARHTIAVGADHLLFVKNDGSLWAVGANINGQLGDGTNVDRSTPVQVATDVKAVAAGASYSLFVKNDGTLWAMGANWYGQLGLGTTIWSYPTPTLVATDVEAVAAGKGHSLFTKRDGSLWAMGYNAFGQLGDGTTENRMAPVEVPVGEYAVVTAIATGGFSSFFITDDNTLWAMGHNAAGKLGDGTTENRATPVQVATGVTAVAAGYIHSLFIKTDGSLWAIGSNDSGQFGDGGTVISSSTSPIQVTTNVTSIAAGEYHSLFIQSDGTLWGMGDNSYGQLGDGTKGTRYTPIPIATGVMEITAFGLVSAYVKSDGGLHSMGANDWGQLGLGMIPITEHLLPIEVSSQVIDTDAGNDYSLFVDTVGTLWAMGENDSGQLGNGTFAPQATAVAVSTDVSKVAAGQTHSFFIKNDGTLWGMGTNGCGQLGDGTIDNQSIPVMVTTNVTEVDAGYIHSLFIKSDGSLWAMGSNWNGQLGDGSNFERTTPVQVATGVTAIAAGAYHSLFVKNDGTLWAMGDNQSGQLGDGTTENRATPVQVATNVIAVAASYYHSLFLKNDGTLWAMGDNRTGQLGDGTTQNRITPVQVATDVTAVATAYNHSLLIKTDGTLWAMGSNQSGQLGDGSEGHSNQVEVESGVAQVTAGLNHSLFIKTDGTLMGCGSTYDGQLNTGVLGYSVTPGAVLNGTNIRLRAMPNDFNGDGKADLMLQSGITFVTQGQSYDGNGSAIGERVNLALNTITPGHQLLGIADVNGDFINDYIVRKLDGSNEYQVQLRHYDGESGNFWLYYPGGADWRLVGVYDQNLDCSGDLIWQNITTGQTVIWFLYCSGQNGTKVGSAVLVPSMADYRIAAVGDLNADGLMDLLWQKVAGDRTDLIAWYLDASGSRTSFKSIASVTGGYRCVGLADYNSDNVNDIVWQRVSSGQVVAWYMSPNGTQTGAKVLCSGDPDQLVSNWQWDLSLPSAAQQDEDGDGKADILWQHGTNGNTVSWRMNGAWGRGSYATVVAANNAPGKLIALVDMDADGVNDYVWCRQESGNNVVTIWLMNADRTLKSQKVVTPAVPTTYTLAGAGDMNSDGMADLLWQQSSNGQLIVWHMDGAGNRQSYSILLASMNGYRVQAVSDMNQDGNADLIWQQQSGGKTQTSIWYMDGAGTRASFRTVNSVPQDWKLGCVGDYNGDGNADMMWFNTSTKQAVGWELDANNARTGTVVVAKNMGDYSIAGL